MKKPMIAAEPVSAYDAKTHLPRLLERTERGERFVITRHGKPVAQLVPVETDGEGEVALAMERVARIRAGLQRRGVRLADVLEPCETVRAFAHRGHRY